MLTRRDRKKFHILEIIKNSDSPVGASQIRSKLKIIGIDISEATAGRFLMELDNKGLTKRDGYKGRILTEKGHVTLKEMDMQHQRMEYGEKFFDILDGKTEEELIDVLIARKAIEREIARLAAINVTPEIEKEMLKTIQLQERDKESSITYQYDNVFHRLIARAANNKVLETMLQLINQDIQLAPILDYIRKQVNSSIAVEHREILKAIINRDPDKSEEAMVNHIDNLIRDVNKFWVDKDYK